MNVGRGWTVDEWARGCGDLIATKVRLVGGSQAGAQLIRRRMELVRSTRPRGSASDSAERSAIYGNQRIRPLTFLAMFGAALVI